MVTTTPAPSLTRRTTSYGHQISLLLAAAFALSVTHTVYSRIAGIGDPRFTVDTPIAWVFYAVGFGAAVLARRTQRWAQWTLLAYLTALLYVSVFYYPTTFVPRQQTVFGWFENDVYTGLLMVAYTLCLYRVRRTTLVPADA